MTKYDADWVREQARGAYYLDHHDCGICGTTVGYRIEADTVLFDGNCDCVSYYSPPRPSSFEEVARWLQAQHSDDIRDSIMKGLKFREEHIDQDQS